MLPFFKLFSNNEFQEFYSRTKRLRKLISISDKEFVVEHYEELRAHFKKIKRLFDKLLRLYSIEQSKIKLLQESQYKERLKTLIADLEIKLNYLRQLIDNGLFLSEKILKIRVVEMITEQKDKLSKVRINIIDMINDVEKESSEISILYKDAENYTKDVDKDPRSWIDMSGRMENLWRLNNIQNVIIELGGRIKQSDGRHPFKIEFPGLRPIPLGPHTPPDELVSEVVKATRKPKNVIRASFSKGELVNA
ncbi:hypothetical protein HYW99_00675 [Candidatus Woesearchaeota archaeon]|nr:hypothetical protein [Candidatus Woesearchaeota archaeon]